MKTCHFCWEIKQAPNLWTKFDGFFVVPCLGLVLWTPQHGRTDCTDGSVKFFLVRTTFSDDLFGEGAELWDDFLSCFLKKGQGNFQDKSER